MNKKYLSVILFGALMLGTTGRLVKTTTMTSQTCRNRLLQMLMPSRHCKIL